VRLRTYHCAQVVTWTRACLMAHEGSQIIREAMTTIAR
jgi:hypothetical protein